MSHEQLRRPDALVLGAGGLLGEAWMTGLLAGIEDATAIRFNQTEMLLGTSAGSIVAASLVAGESLRRPRSARSSPPARGFKGDVREARDGARDEGGDEPADISPVAALARGAAGLALAATAPLLPIAVRVGVPGGALVRAAALARVPSTGQSLSSLGAGVRRSGASFDGRLRIACVDRRSGRRVIFGAPGAPRASVADAVRASCAVPWMFEAVRIGEREYVDGGVWSPTNLDAIPAGRDSRVLCLSVIAGVGARPGLDPLRAAARAALAVETAILTRRGAQLRTIGPDARSADAIGPNLMNPGRRERVLAAGFAQGFALAQGA